METYVEEGMDDSMDDSMDISIKLAESSESLESQSSKTESLPDQVVEELKKYIEEEMYLKYFSLSGGTS